MGKFLVEQFPAADLVFEEASDALNFNLKKLCFDASEKDLALTQNTQPAIFTTSAATLHVLQTEWGLSPSMTAGHSVGEYAALYASKVISLADGVKAVRARGTWMQEAVPVGKGGMAAVMGLTADETIQMCAWAQKQTGDSPLTAANFNCPGQIVISGKKALIDWLVNNLDSEKIFSTNKRIKLIPLQVSAPFHCAMMKPAQEKMMDFLKTIPFKPADTPVLQNFTAKKHTKTEEIFKNLVEQISAPVLWMQSMQELKSENIKVCIEVGAGKVLGGLLKKIDSEWFEVFNLNSSEDLKHLETLKD